MSRSRKATFADVTDILKAQKTTLTDKSFSEALALLRESYEVDEKQLEKMRKKPSAADMAEALHRHGEDVSAAINDFRKEGRLVTSSREAKYKEIVKAVAKRKLKKNFDDELKGALGDLISSQMSESTLKELFSMLKEIKLLTETKMSAAEVLELNNIIKELDETIRSAINILEYAQYFEAAIKSNTLSTYEARDTLSDIKTSITTMINIALSIKDQQGIINTSKEDGLMSARRRMTFATQRKEYEFLTKADLQDKTVAPRMKKLKSSLKSWKDKWNENAYKFYRDIFAEDIMYVSLATVLNKFKDIFDLRKLVNLNSLREVDEYMEKAEQWALERTTILSTLTLTLNFLEEAKSTAPLDSKSQEKLLKDTTKNRNFLIGMYLSSLLDPTEKFVSSDMKALSDFLNRDDRKEKRKKIIIEAYKNTFAEASFFLKHFSALPTNFDQYTPAETDKITSESANDFYEKSFAVLEALQFLLPERLKKKEIDLDKLIESLIRMEKEVSLYPKIFADLMGLKDNKDLIGQASETLAKMIKALNTIKSFAPTVPTELLKVKAARKAVRIKYPDAIEALNPKSVEPKEKKVSTQADLRGYYQKLGVGAKLFSPRNPPRTDDEHKRESERTVRPGPEKVKTSRPFSDRSAPPEPSKEKGDQSERKAPDISGSKKK